MRRLEKVLSDDRAAEAAIGGVDLGAFIPKRSYSLKALGAHFTPASPVFRFSTRLALAMMAGSVVAQFLGDSGHGNWVLLTIAVVMRAGYGLTRQRRDDRVVGTLVGCVAAAGAVATLPAGALVAAQGLGVGVTHSFARRTYRLSSVGASVTALVSLHLAQPSLPAPILARLADTLIGAAIAHLFSYVWPHCGIFRGAGNRDPRAGAIGGLRWPGAQGGRADPGIPARPQKYDRGARCAVGLAGRMSIEPNAARRGLDEMAALLMAAQGLVAQLLGGAARRQARPRAAPRRRGARLASGAARPESRRHASDSPPPSGPLVDAALAVIEAARRYRRAAQIEASER